MPKTPITAATLLRGLTQLPWGAPLRAGKEKGAVLADRALFRWAPRGGAPG